MKWKCAGKNQPKSCFEKVLIAYYDKRDINPYIYYGIARCDSEKNWDYECLNKDEDSCSSNSFNMSNMGFEVLYWAEIPDHSLQVNHSED